MRSVLHFLPALIMVLRDLCAGVGCPLAVTVRQTELNSHSSNLQTMDKAYKCAEQENEYEL